MRRKEEKRIKRILMRNCPPETDREKVSAFKRELNSRAAGMDLQVYAPGESFGTRILRQVPYITGWVWIVQAAAVALLGVAAGKNITDMETGMFFSLSAPVLALLPVVDIVRSYGHNMCEMEAACRYDLRQITAMRMCVIGGADILLLTLGGWFYREKCGSIWEFVLFVLLPFLASSSLYCWELHRFSAGCSGFALLGTGILLEFVCYPVLRDVYLRMTAEHPEQIPAAALSAAAVLSVILAFLSVRLCAGIKGGGLARAGRSHTAGA